MRLGGDLQPGNVIASLRFLGKGDKQEKVVTVKEPAGTKDVEDVEDRIGVGGHVLLGDTRSSPAPSMVAYGGTREDRGKSSRGDLGRQHTGDGGGKWKRRMKGNLVVFAGPDITCDALFATLYLCWMT